ncbi:MAG: hypothetical protein M3Y60_05305 [Bacteroidota bacterium]|nr:hypothetical protein [Bacteroidota bacterium]
MKKSLLKMANQPTSSLVLGMGNHRMVSADAESGAGSSLGGTLTLGWEPGNVVRELMSYAT